MNLTVDFREQLDSVSTWITEQFDRIIATIKAIWGVQHYPDGRHAAITGDSIVVTGAGTFGGDGSFNGNVTADADGSPIIAGVLAASGGIRAGNGIDLRTNSAGSPLGRWRIATFVSASSERELMFQDIVGALGPYTFRIFWDGSSYILQPESASPLNLGRDTTGGRIQHIYVTNGVHEHGRSAAMGEWTAVAFAAGNFTASGTQTWTVTSGQQVAYSWMIIGKTMFLAFTINGSSVGGVASTELRIAIPGGFLAATGNTLGAIRSFDNGVDTVGFCGTVVGAAYVRLWRSGFTNWAASALNTSVQGLAVFEVQ